MVPEEQLGDTLMTQESLRSREKYTIDSYSRQFIYLDLIWIYIYISLFIDCLFEIHKIAVFFLLLSLQGHYRVTDED